MCDKELLVAYLYDELNASERERFDAHLASCAECRDEMHGLQETRTRLASWTPPEPALAFHVVRGATAPARRFRVSPAWGLAAAAVLVMGAASAIANLEVKYGADGFAVRTGWARAATPQPASSFASEASFKPDLQLIDQRLRSLEAGAAARDGSARVTVPGPRISDAELLRQVRRLISDSEARQRRLLAAQILQVARDVELARRTDLARLQQGLQHRQGLTDLEVVRQRQMIDNLVRVAQQQK